MKENITNDWGNVEKTARAADQGWSREKNRWKKNSEKDKIL